MKVSKALQIINAAPATASPYRVMLACGFTPLHLNTFLVAHLQEHLPHRKVAAINGLYGDLAGTLQRSRAEQVDAVAVAIEWPDLDPRLGYRNLGGWGPAEEPDIVGRVQSALAQLGKLTREVAASKPVVISFPTLALPPAFHTARWQAGSTQAVLEAAVHNAAADLAGERNILVLNSQQLAWNSPPANRFDLKSDLFTGLPYTVQHATALGQAMAFLIAPPSPRKGLITDLDDTLWNGIVGEAGVQGVSWDLAGHTQLHGLYQQTLRALADQGVLIAIASRNDPGVIDAAFSRADLLLPKDKIFPLEANWHAKSASVARILQAWNVSAAAVVFVDDSPMELAEVQATFPDMECLRFPKDDYAGAEGFLRRLRDLFAKPWLSSEDNLRRESLRQGARFMEELAGVDASDEFLRSLDAHLTIDRHAAADPRALELVNKTNQFNLNGRRFEPAEWQAAAAREGGFVWSLAYQDKFGPLGKIAVVHGRCQNGAIEIETWVMSCRAFARRIEHQCLRLLFEQNGAKEMAFHFLATGRNGPLQEFLTAFLGAAPGPEARLSRELFFTRCPPLFHTISGIAE